MENAVTNAVMNAVNQVGMGAAIVRSVMDYSVEVIDESLANEGFFGGATWMIQRKADDATPTHVSIWLEPVRV